MAEQVQRSDEEWRTRLTPEEYAVLREAATERPWTGALLDEDRAGLYTCAACGPSCSRAARSSTPAAAGRASTSPCGPRPSCCFEDTSLGEERTEVRCARCGSHLGHVFPDGFGTPTGDRYCMNSIALDFTPD